MTHEEAFLDDIAEHPDDDAPRLIYADWLDDHGDAARAEYIRVECELARLGEYDERARPLRRRSKDLKEQNEDRWLGPLKGHVSGWGFRRGLLEEIVVHPEAFVEHAEEWLQLVPISSVALMRQSSASDLHRFFQSPHLARIRHLSIWLAESGHALTEALRDCHRLKRLKSLSLTGCSIQDEGLRELCQAPFLEQLRGLDLSENQFGASGVESLSGCANLCRLESLDLDNGSITAICVELLAVSPHLGALRRLSLGRNKFGPAGARALAAGPHLGNLKNLNLYECLIADAGLEALARSPQLRSLERLDLSCNGLGPASGTTLASAPFLANLRELDLSNNRLGPAGVSALARSSTTPPLRSLNVTNNQLGDEGVAALAKWAAIKHLHELGLSCEEITAFGLKEVLTSLRDGTLRVLKLCNNPLHPLGAQVLARWPGLAKLERLDLGCNQFGDEGLLTLMNSPHLPPLERLDLGNNDCTEPTQDLIHQAATRAGIAKLVLY